MGILRYLINIFDKILVTEKCINCRSKGSMLCKNCLKLIPSPEHDLPEHIYALYEYRDPAIKKILTDAKYRGKFAGLNIFERVMYDAMTDIISEYSELNNYKNIMVIPVPISKKRFKERGYNQAEIITKSILRNNSEYKLGNNIFKKIINKTPQASIHNRKERLLSPRGTFEISEHIKVKDCMCIIVDDITTTGGTINEMRRLLLEAGALTVVGLTIAH